MTRTPEFKLEQWVRIVRNGYRNFITAVRITREFDPESGYISWAEYQLYRDGKWYYESDLVEDSEEAVIVAANKSLAELPF